MKTLREITEEFLNDMEKASFTTPRFWELFSTLLQVFVHLPANAAAPFDSDSYAERNIALHRFVDVLISFKKATTDFDTPSSSSVSLLELKQQVFWSRRELLESTPDIATPVIEHAAPDSSPGVN